MSRSPFKFSTAIPVTPLLGRTTDSITQPIPHASRSRMPTANLCWQALFPLVPPYLAPAIECGSSFPRRDRLQDQHIRCLVRVQAEMEALADQPAGAPAGEGTELPAHLPA